MAKSIKELEMEKQRLIEKQKKIDEKIKAFESAEKAKKRKEETQLLILYGRYRMMKEIERISQTYNQDFEDKEFLGFLKGVSKNSAGRAEEIAQERYKKFLEIVRQKLSTKKEKMD